jgi:ketosteroid isomerase-like protein
MSTPERRAVEAMFTAFRNHDLQGALRTVSDDTVWIHHGTQKLPSLRFVHKKGVEQFFAINFASMKMEYFRVNRFLQDGNTVAAFGEEKFTMEGQEGAMAQKWVQVYTVDNGLITRMEEFATSVDDADYRVVS